MKMNKKNYLSFVRPFSLLRGAVLFFILLISGLASAQVSVIAFDDSGNEIAAGAPNDIIFEISRIPLNGTATTVNYVLSGDATEGVDYTALSGSVTLTNAAPTAQVVITGIVDDDIVEGDELVLIELTSATNGTIGTQNTASALLFDNDMGIVSFDILNPGFDDEATEGIIDTGNFRIVLDKGKGQGVPLSVGFTLSGTANASGVNDDFELTGPAVNAAQTAVVYPVVYTTTRHIGLEALEDLLDEGTETVTMTLTTVNNPLFSIDPLNNVATINIINTPNQCSAGTEAPALNATTDSEYCDVANVNLNTFVTGGVASAPTGSSLRWSLIPNPTLPTDLLANAQATVSDTYYGLYWADDDSCFSPVLEIELVINSTPDPGALNNNNVRCNQTGQQFGTAINLNNAITGEDTGGTWTYVSGGDGPISITNSGVVNFLGEPADTYVFNYALVGEAPCESADIDVPIMVSSCVDCDAGDEAPELEVATPTVFCDDITVSLNDYTSSTPPTGSELKWSKNSDPTIVASHLTAAEVNNVSDAGIYYGFFWDEDNTCASPALEIEIIINTAPNSGTPVANLERCNTAGNGNAVSINLNNAISGQDAGGTWEYVSGGTGDPGINVNDIVNFTGDAAGVYIFSYTVLGVAPCEDAVTEATITVTDCTNCNAGTSAPELAPNAPETNYCSNNNEQVSLNLDDFTNSTPPANTELRWSTLSNVLNENAHLASSSINISAGATYYGFFWDDANSCASEALVITIGIRELPNLTVGGDETRCGPGEVNFTATATVGGSNATINWYTTMASNSIVGTGQTFSPNVTETTMYFVEATFNGCTTSPRIGVEATVVPQTSAGMPVNDNGLASACSDANNGPTIFDLDDLLVGQDAGNWEFNDGPAGENITLPSNNIINFVNRASGAYMFTFTTVGAQAPCVNESQVITISVNNCDIDSDSDGLLDGVEASLGTNPNEQDTDGDGINDGVEVGGDINNPLNGDGDEFIDALDSNIADDDNDGVVNQTDPGNLNPCLPNTMNGICDSDSDGITDSDEALQNSDPFNPCDPDPENSFCNAVVDLEVLKSVNSIDAQVGESVIFTITVNNVSDKTASSILIGDLLESGFEYVSHSPEDAQYDPDNGEWNIMAIDPSESTTLEITVNVIQDGVYTNTAELLDVFQTDSNPSNDVSETITLNVVDTNNIDLAIEKTAQNPTPLVGDDVIFVLTVKNTSIEEIDFTNIEVHDLIEEDSGFVFVSAAADGDSSYDENTGVWLINNLAFGSEISLEITVNVPETGSFTNTTEIKSSIPEDVNIENNTATAEVIVSSANSADVGALFNQFSPNGDQRNDFLSINLKDSNTGQVVDVIYNIQIFNRYGNIVFENKSTRIDNASETIEVWDGTWKGDNAPEGTYYYTMSIDVGNGSEFKKGWIQLIR